MPHIPHWERHLASALVTARTTPFAWGRHDCATWAFELRTELTGGPDTAARWRGRYSTCGLSQSTHSFRKLLGLGRRVVMCGGVAIAVLAAVALIWRSGRKAGKTALIAKRNEARIRTLKTSLEVRTHVSQPSPADLRRRLDRWMRD